MPDQLLDPERARVAIRALGQELSARGITDARISVVGGVAVLFQTYERNSTVDVDALLAPEEEVLECAAVVAQRLNLPYNWLNSAAKAFLSDGYSGRGIVVKCVIRGQSPRNGLQSPPTLRPIPTKPAHLSRAQSSTARRARTASG